MPKIFKAAVAGATVVSAIGVYFIQSRKKPEHRASHWFHGPYLEEKEAKEDRNEENLNPAVLREWENRYDSGEKLLFREDGTFYRNGIPQGTFQTMDDYVLVHGPYDHVACYHLVEDELGPMLYRQEDGKPVLQATEAFRPHVPDGN